MCSAAHDCDKSSMVCDEENYTDKVGMHEINYTNLIEGKIGIGGCVNEAAVCAVDSASLLGEQLVSHQGELNRAGTKTHCHHSFCPKNGNYLVKGTSGPMLDQKFSLPSIFGGCSL